MYQLFAMLGDTKQHAVVGHDVVRDVKLLVSEAVRIGMNPAYLFHLRRVLCTKELSVGHCRLPLPSHLRYEDPCDVLLEQVNGVSLGDVPSVFKWPTLLECYTLLAHRVFIAPSHRCHDARDPGILCQDILLPGR